MVSSAPPRHLLSTSAALFLFERPALPVVVAGIVQPRKPQCLSAGHSLKGMPRAPFFSPAIIPLQ